SCGASTWLELKIPWAERPVQVRVLLPALKTLTLRDAMLRALSFRIGELCQFCATPAARRPDRRPVSLMHKGQLATPAGEVSLKNGNRPRASWSSLPN